MKIKPTPVIATALICCFPIVAAVAQSTQPMMKAAVLHEYGGPEVLKYEDTPRPEPQDDEVLVRVMAAGVNPVDAYVRQGMLSKRGLDERPMVIGYDIGGVMEKTGGKVKTFKGSE